MVYVRFADGAESRSSRIGFCCTYSRPQGLKRIGYGTGDYTTGDTAQDQTGDLDAAVFCGDVLNEVVSGGGVIERELRAEGGESLAAGDDLEAV